jgi:hypothetical protein
VKKGWNLNVKVHIVFWGTLIRKDIDKGGYVCMFKMGMSRSGKDPTKICRFGKDHAET